MLLVPDPKTRTRRLREVLREARDTYRRHRGASPAPAPPPPVPVRGEDPDVLLDVPRLHVDDIELKLDELHARVALEAHVLDLLRLDVGVTADLRGVDLEIAGVDAEALLKVRLDNLAQIVDRVMRTIESNPQILDGLVRDLGRGLGAGAGALRRAS